MATTKLNRNQVTEDGWIPVRDSWSYASATTITVPSGAASKYAKGDRIKLTQTTVKYFVVVGVADTVLTVTGGSDYSVANAAISAIYYSHELSPVGYPDTFAYTPTVTSTGLTSYTSNGKFSASKGYYYVYFFVNITNIGTSNGYFTVSLPITPGAGTQLLLGITDGGKALGGFVGTNIDTRDYNNGAVRTNNGSFSYAGVINY